MKKHNRFYKDPKEGQEQEDDAAVTQVASPEQEGSEANNVEGQE